MPIRVCAEPACPNLATSRGRCQTHARTHDRGIIRAGYHVYRTKRWRITRDRYLSSHPLCATCDQIAEHVHHITDLKDGGQPYDPAGLQSLCHSCHSKITARRSATDA